MATKNVSVKNKSTTRTFRVLVTRTKENDGFMANVPSLEYCVAFGDTIEDAIKNLNEALEGVLETMVENGISIPDDSLSLETTITLPLKLSNV